MILVLLLLFLTYVSYQIRFSILTELILRSNDLHNTCLNLLPKNPQTQALLQALVCGHNFESFETAQLYTSSGLIHLFVVSGSHLLLIFRVLDFIFKKIELRHSKKIILSLLFLYAAVCLFNPPVTRSLVGLILIDILSTKIKYWPKDFVVLLAGLFCLMLSPSWVSSLSLQMSWLAALGIVFNQRYLKNSRKLTQQMPFYIFYTLTFSALGFPQIAIIVISLFFTPVLEFILLPLAFLVLAFPFCDPLFEIVITVLNFVLSHLELSTSDVITPFENTIVFNWYLIFLIQLFLHFNNKKT